MCYGFAGTHVFSYEEIAKIAARLTEREVQAALEKMKRESYSPEVVQKAAAAINAHSGHHLVAA